jgi:hypothetical protein
LGPSIHNVFKLETMVNPFIAVRHCFCSICMLPPQQLNGSASQTDVEFLALWNLFPSPLLHNIINEGISNGFQFLSY